MNKDITQILKAYGAGTPNADNDLFNMVYDRLKVMARSRLGYQAHDQTLNTTVLVNEAYMKMFGKEPKNWSDRQHFYAVAATAMRQIIIDNARSKLSAKRKKDDAEDDVEEIASEKQKVDELLSINNALNQMMKSHPNEAKVFECRYFVGFSTQETSEALNIPVRTIERLWSSARTFMREQLS